MIQSIPRSGPLLARAFLPAATRYWLDVFPAVEREVARCETLASQIPDPILRRLAVEALRSERGNLEGAAAFAAFLPRRLRPSLVRALVCFQAVYDYIDAISEQPGLPPGGDVRRLHGALVAALSAERAGRPRYCRHRGLDDGGYLHSLIERCSRAVGALPSYGVVAKLAQTAADRIAVYQSLNLSERQGGRRGLEQWARTLTSPCGEFLWWETAAAAGSSLLVFALLAAAASPDFDGRHLPVLARAYFPWIGALHTMLDSLADRAEDAAEGYRSFVDYYGSPEHAARRLQALAIGSARLLRKLPSGAQHSLILAAMISFYLSLTDPRCPFARLARPLLIHTMGQLALPTMLTMRARQGAKEVRRSLGTLTRRARRGRTGGCDAEPRG